MNNTQTPPVQDPNAGIVQFDVPGEAWGSMSVQQQVLYIIHNLIDFSTTPAFCVFAGFRMQVKQTGIIMPIHVPLVLGKAAVGPRIGRH